jgi:hypothetical protein
MTTHYDKDSRALVPGDKVEIVESRAWYAERGYGNGVICTYLGPSEDRTCIRIVHPEHTEVRIYSSRCRYHEPQDWWDVWGAP